MYERTVEISGVTRKTRDAIIKKKGALTYEQFFKKMLEGEML